MKKFSLVLCSLLAVTAAQAGTLTLRQNEGVVLQCESGKRPKVSRSAAATVEVVCGQNDAPPNDGPELATCTVVKLTTGAYEVQVKGQAYFMNYSESAVLDKYKQLKNLGVCTGSSACTLRQNPSRSYSVLVDGKEYFMNYSEDAVHTKYKELREAGLCQ